MQTVVLSGLFTGRRFTCLNLPEQNYTFMSRLDGIYDQHSTSCTACSPIPLPSYSDSMLAHLSTGN